MDPRPPSSNRSGARRTYDTSSPSSRTLELVGCQLGRLLGIQASSRDWERARRAVLLRAHELLPTGHVGRQSVARPHLWLRGAGRDTGEDDETWDSGLLPEVAQVQRRPAHHRRLCHLSSDSESCTRSSGSIVAAGLHGGVSSTPRSAGVEVFQLILDGQAVSRLAASCARQGYHPTFAIFTNNLPPRPARHGSRNLQGMIVGLVGLPLRDGLDPPQRQSSTLS